MLRYPSLTFGSVTGLVNGLLLAATGESPSVIVSLSTGLTAVVFALVYLVARALPACFVLFTPIKGFLLSEGLSNRGATV